MSISYTIDLVQKFIHVTILDNSQLVDIVDVVEKYQLDEAFYQGLNVIFDISDGSVNLTGNDMISLVSFLQIEGNIVPFKLALVISADVVFGQGRMFEAYAETLPFSLKLFRDMPSCLQWIKAPD